jgi:hypothetical protein
VGEEEEEEVDVEVEVKQAGVMQTEGENERMRG